ncbi:hypothetical protein ES703_27115 [subsurface metagenome]
MKRLKLWHWVLIALLLVAGLVAGIGFIPVTEQVPYACTKTEEYPCMKTEVYTCTKVREVTCTKTETYEYTVQVPYTTVEDQPLTYSSWGAGADESWWDCDVWIWVNVRNTDSEGGYFSVKFSCRKGASWHTQTQTQYVAPGEAKEFKVEFLKDRGVEWAWRYPEVTPPTKQVTVQKYRTETRIGTREVQYTCPEPYETTCTREVEDTCTRQYQDTCYRDETRWLLWSW